MPWPHHKNALRAVVWGVALASALALWYTFVHRRDPEPGERVARVTALVGSVRARPGAAEAWSVLRFEDRLHVGDAVRTEELSGAELSFDAGGVVRVRPESRVDIGGSPDEPNAAWRVQSGGVGFSVGDRVTRIVTPTAATTAEEGTSGDISVGASGETGVRIFRGQVEVETRTGKTLVLLEGEAVEVDARGHAGDKEELPPPPTPLSPPIETILPPGPTAELTWEPVAGAKTYHVSLDYNVMQANLGLSSTLDVPGLTQPRHELTGLDPGRYFWRVAAVNEEGFEGPFSRVSSFKVEPLIELE